LKRIAVEFARMVRDGVLNKPNPVKAISDSDRVFPLPPGWELARFNQIASIKSNLVDPGQYKEMPHIAPDNLESWTAKLLPYVSVAEAGVFSGKHLFSAGAILYSKIRPNLAKVTKVDFGGLCSADMYPIHALIDPDFLVKSMITPDFVSQAVREDNRVAMPKINQAALSDILVRVPPLAEQRRIVAKVDELMGLCDRLRTNLTTTSVTRRRLLDALLAEALAPRDERDLEAAE
jgi:type I restriction enzyme, S subunit